MPDAHALPPHWLQILLALADEDRHGLGIMSEVLEQTGGGMRLWPAMLYRNLQRLAEEGLIVEIPAPSRQPGSPRYFRITAAGRRAAAAAARRLDGIGQTALAKRQLTTRLH
jgi:DNA-binding PadR family transcriptional regulator